MAIVVCDWLPTAIYCCLLLSIAVCGCLRRSAAVCGYLWRTAGDCLWRAGCGWLLCCPFWSQISLPIAFLCPCIFLRSLAGTFIDSGIAEPADAPVPMAAVCDFDAARNSSVTLDLHAQVIEGPEQQPFFSEKLSWICAFQAWPGAETLSRHISRVARRDFPADAAQQHITAVSARRAAGVRARGRSLLLTLTARRDPRRLQLLQLESAAGLNHVHSSRPCSLKPADERRVTAASSCSSKKETPN